jgi:hypothetical protein
MNIFILDRDIQKCVEYHVDKHVLKMCLEYAQLLSGVHRFYGQDVGYKLTHKNHPCSIWARASLSNYKYLKELAIALGDEYTYRYKKQHKSILMVKELPEIEFVDVGITEFAKAIAIPEIKAIPDAVEAYRAYYKHSKADLFKWKNREIPDWI